MMEYLLHFIQVDPDFYKVSHALENTVAQLF